MKTDLLKMTENGGCSAKISPRQLDEILQYLPIPADPNILVNIDTHDDAGVYKINDDLALVVTTDFFPPVCSDPFEYGQIAAANSVSDVYAMGGKPVIALNIMMFPSAKLPMEDYAAILRGGYEKASEAGVRIIGGHTIDDYPPKYGLAVIGYVHPDKIVTNSGAKPGDKLILTKPVGTGIILAAHRLGLASDSDYESAKVFMKMLNNTGAEVMQKSGVKGATDITGYGLAGHALKMARAAEVSIRLKMSSIPLIGDTYRLVDEGCIPGAAFRNLDFADKDSCFEEGLDYNLKMIAMDAQTSGGLLISVREELAETLISELRSKGLGHSSVIGTVTVKEEKYLYLDK